MKIHAELRQKFAFSVLFLMGPNLLIGCSYRARQDTWIALAAVTVLMVLWGFVLAKIEITHPGKDVFELVKSLPKLFVKPMILILTVFCIGQAALTLRTYSGFVHVVSLPNTGILVLLALSCTVIYWFLQRDRKTLLRFSYLSVIPIVFIVLLLFLFLIPAFRTENLFPVAYRNTENTLYCTVENLAFPFGNAFLLLGLNHACDKPKRERLFYFFVMLAAGGISLIIVLQNILLLGGALSDGLDFPYNFAASLVNVGDFFSRIEVFSSLFFFLSAIVRTAYLADLARKGICSLISADSNKIALPFVFFLFAYSAVAFDNTNSVFNYLQIFPFVAIPLQFLFPLLILMCSVMKNRRRGRRAGILREENRVL